MNIFLCAFCVSILFALSILVNKRSGYILNPVSVIVYLFGTLLLSATIFAKSAGLFEISAKCILIVFIFLFIIEIVFLAAIRYRKTKFRTIWLFANSNRLYLISIICFGVFLVSTFVYYYNLNTYIPLTSILTRMWKWKNLVLTNTIDERNIIYIGRNLPLFGMLFSVTFIVNKNKRKTMALILVVYIALSFLNPRREPIIKNIIYISVPFIIAYKNKIGRLLAFAIPIVIVFAVIFSELSNQLSFGEMSFSQSISLYTIGPFCSLSKALEMGYPRNTNLPYGNMLYFIYSLLKYFSTSLTPPDITLNSLDSNTTNVYTCLIAPLIDSDGFSFLMIFNVCLYALYTGLIISFVVAMYHKHHNVSSLFLLCSCTSSAVRSFFNPTFSYTEFLQGLLIAVLLSFIFEESFIFNFSKKGNLEPHYIDSKVAKIFNPQFVANKKIAR